MEAILSEASAITSTTSDFNDTSESEIGESENNEMENKTFTKLASEQRIHLKFEKIRYTASLGFRKGTKEILHEISGSFPPGQLIAIMGPSGAGKSTLLDILSGYRIRGVTGSVTTNNIQRNLQKFRKSSCYIQQDDRLEGLLTVYENMLVSADLKLPTSTGLNKKNAIIDDILSILGLIDTKNTKTLRLSGGQRKRLSIALELVNNPTVMFLDEPTTGLDSSSCSQCIKLLKKLTLQGRTIICTIHQPSATLFQLFDQVYVLGSGRCLYQGSTKNLIPFLNDVEYSCPQYHNPADFIIELACEEYGIEIVDKMVETTNNGKNLFYFDKNVDDFKVENGDTAADDQKGLQGTSPFNQLKVLLRRGWIKMKRDRTLTYLRVAVNFLVGLMLGAVYWKAGSDGSKVLDNYNLLFSILMHHMMSTMMLTILTFPNEMSILIKEHFNRWYSLKMYYTYVTLIDIPVSIAACTVFSVTIFYATDQPSDSPRFWMFLIISLLVVFIAQSFGLMIGGVFNVVNGTFIGPALSIPMMMFAGFGVTLRDLPSYMYWGSYISYLRYGLEGFVAAIYGLNRDTISCPEEAYCHYKYPKKFLQDVAMKDDQFGNDIIALLLILFFLRIFAYVFLRYKLIAIR